jgi:Zinc knuckle
LVPSFNESFLHLQRNIEVVDTLENGLVKPKYPPIENTLLVAQKLHMDYLATGKWTGLTTKANQSSFVVQPGNNNNGNKNSNGNKGPRKLSCWNCGADGHSIKECTKPVNQPLIDQGKKAFREARKKGKANNWAPPTKEEKKIRVINGKPMFYVKSKKRWENDKGKGVPVNPTANPAANIPPTPSPSVPSTPAPVPMNADAAKASKVS